WAIDGGSRSVTGADGAALAAMALLFAADVARSATAVGVQYHGGYGYAEEHEAQRLYRHARGTALGGGGLDAVLDELAAAVVAGEAG
ncbi:MAG: acyl-CoA dehydrogenase family protein, partial [Acidimicrobiales bacterium]